MQRKNKKRPKKPKELLKRQDKEAKTKQKLESLRKSQLRKKPRLMLPLPKLKKRRQKP